MDCIGPFCGLLFLATIFTAEAALYQHTETSDDKIVESDGFPGPYPTDVNVTWYFHRQHGQWAVVFMAFVLDVDSTRSEDWLEIDDGARRLKYNNYTSPPPHIVSHGPRLTIRFETDRKTDQRSLGFQLKVLHDTDINNLHLKIHEAKHRKKEEEGGGVPTSLLIILIVILFVLIVISVLTIIGLIIYRRRRNSRKKNYPRDPRMRNDSVAFHQISGSVRQEGDQNNQHHRQQPQQQQQHNHQQQHHHHQQQQQQQHHHQETRVKRPSQDHSRQNNQGRKKSSSERQDVPVEYIEPPPRIQRPSVQRSNSKNSQMNWILRAELSTALKTADRRSKPNLYTSSPQAVGAQPNFDEQPGNHDSSGNHNVNKTENVVNGIHDYGLREKQFKCFPTQSCDIPNTPPIRKINNQDQNCNNNNFSTENSKEPKSIIDLPCKKINVDFEPYHKGNGKSPTSPKSKPDFLPTVDNNNIYTNGVLSSPSRESPSITETNETLQNTMRNDDFHPLDKVPRVCNNNKIHLSASHENNKLPAGNMLYVNVHVSQSQTNIQPHTSFSNLADANSRHTDSPIYSNLATSLLGMQASALLSVNDDAVAGKGSNSSLNKIVLSVAQEAGAKENVPAEQEGDNNGDLNSIATLRLDTALQRNLTNEAYVNLEDLQLTTNSSPIKMSPDKNLPGLFHNGNDVMLPDDDGGDEAGKNREEKNCIYDIPRGGN